MDEYRYTIPGPPTYIYKTGEEARQPLDTYQEHKLRAIVWLENQQEDRQFMKIPIEASFVFYLPRNFLYRPAATSIVELFKFANHISRGLLYKKDYLLYNVKLEKKYSRNPRTEIIIKPIKGETDANAKIKKEKIKPSK